MTLFNPRHRGVVAAVGLTVAFAISGCGGESVSDDAPLFETEDAHAEDCEHGGVVLRSGFDESGDGVMDSLIQETIICNGAPGDHGEDGDQGDDGGTSLMTTDAEAPGDNCEHGGIRIDIGLDADNTGELAEDEIDDTQFVCNHLCGTGQPLEITIEIDALPAEFSTGGSYTVPVISDAEALAIDAVIPAGEFDIDVYYDFGDEQIVFEHNAGTGVVDLALFITDGCDLTTKSVRLGPF